MGLADGKAPLPISKHSLPLNHGLKPGTPAFGPAMRIGQTEMEAFKVAVGLRAPYAGGAMDNVPNFQANIMGLLVGPAEGVLQATYPEFSDTPE